MINRNCGRKTLRIKSWKLVEEIDYTEYNLKVIEMEMRSRLAKTYHGIVGVHVESIMLNNRLTVTYQIELKPDRWSDKVLPDLCSWCKTWRLRGQFVKKAITFAMLYGSWYWAIFLKKSWHNDDKLTPSN